MEASKDSPKKPGAKDGQIGLSKNDISHVEENSLMIYLKQIKYL